MVNFSGAATGAASGAATGSSFGGPIGAVGGALIGGIAGLFGSKKPKKKKLSAFDKRQQELNKQQHKAVMGRGPLADLYNYDPEQANAVFDKTKARPALRQFKEETVPGITGAFRSEGLMNSSYAGDALAKAGRDVQENLDALRSEYLYNEQKDARSAKRSAVDSLQGRQTFAYDVGQKPFDISQLLNSIPGESKDYFKGLFSKDSRSKGVV